MDNNNESKLFKIWNGIKGVKCVFITLTAFALIYIIVMSIFSIIYRASGGQFIPNKIDPDANNPDGWICTNGYDCFDGMRINNSIPYRKFYSNNDIVDQSLMDISISPCQDFYGHACGKYNLGIQNELVNVMKYENAMFRTWIERNIINNDNILCIDGSIACKNLLEFYRQCVKGKHSTDPTLVSNKIIQEMNKFSENRFERIRFLTQQGITNYIHLTKEPMENDTYCHYLRPGNVLMKIYDSKMMRVDLTDLYGNDYEDSGMRVMDIATFNKMVGSDWTPIFGKFALQNDTVKVESSTYMINLNNFLNSLNVADFNKITESFVKIHVGHMSSTGCLEKTKMLFFMTLCRIFRRLNRMGDVQTASDVMNNITNYMFSKYGDKMDLTSVRMGLCSAIMHSSDMGDEQFENENSVNITNLKNQNYLEWIYEDMMKRSYRIYDPIFLYYSYPRILIRTDWTMDDPLDWYTQVNAYYDSFNDEVVFPPGMLAFPMHDENFNNVSRYSGIGYVLGHEVSHSLQEKMKDDCLMVENNRRYESFADIIGLSSSFETFLQTNPDIIEKRRFFLRYAQIFCAAYPDKVYGDHDSSRFRVNNPIKYGSNILLREFNNAFKCSIEEKCIKK